MQRGFTLVEVLVSLIIVSIIVGNVMGLFSSSLRFSSRLQNKKDGWSILEAAAQQILVQPEVAQQETLVVEYMDDEPEVDIKLEQVTSTEAGDLLLKNSGLYRTRLSYAGNILEFSIIIPEN